MESLSPKREER